MDLFPRQEPNRTRKKSSQRIEDATEANIEWLDLAGRRTRSGLQRGFRLDPIITSERNPLGDGSALRGADRGEARGMKDA